MVSILLHKYYCMFLGGGNILRFALCLKSSLKSQTVFAIQILCLFVLICEQKEYDNYF